MLTIGGVSLFVRLFAFYKETAIASIIGLSELLDTFYIAILIPSFIQNVFIGGLKQLFIPNYLAEQQDFKSKATFQSVTFLLILMMTAILAIISIIFVEYGLEYVFPNHDFHYYNLIRKQFYIILPCLLFWGLGSLLGGLLEIENKFFATSVSAIFPPLGSLITLFYFKDVLEEYVLAVGILLGTAISFLFLTIIAVKHHILQFGKIIINSNIKAMLHQLPHKITSSFLSGINPFVDQFFAAQLAIGSIGAINYGVKIPTFAVGILMLVLGNVLLPHFSTLVLEDRERSFVQLFKVLKTVFIFTVTCVIIGMIFSKPIISLLFERDAFTSKDTEIVSKLQIIALAYVPFYLCTLVCVKFLTAINKNKFMAWTSAWNFIANLLLNWLLIEHFGIYGLVGSTSLMFIISSLIYINYTWRLYKNEYPQKVN